jgi:hypothetical protein
MTLRGGGGKTLPGMTWCSGCIGVGAGGGLSLMTNGAKIRIYSIIFVK